MRAVKGNKSYLVDEKNKAQYLSQGYDIQDDEGNILEYARGKTVTYEKYAELEKAHDELTAAYEKIRTELTSVKAENEQLKSAVDQKDATPAAETKAAKK